MSVIALNVKGAVGRAQVAYGNEDDVHDGPNSQTTKTEQLADTFLPVA